MNQMPTSTATNPSDQTAQITTGDRFNRPLKDLRISVIDRCNLRCSYCMPPEGLGEPYSFLDKKEWLSFDEIRRLVRAFVRLGVTKVRITGGEPLLRKDLPGLIRALRAIPDLQEIALTTNGIFLGGQAASLRDAGLDRLTVSLDTLDEKTFAKINGYKASVRQILEGLHAAEAAGFQNIKINAVIQKDVNDSTAVDLVRHFKGTGHIVRFIEFMDVGNRNQWRLEKVCPTALLVKAIHKVFPLETLKPAYPGEVAQRYRFMDGEGEIGFISSVTQPFCGTCTRARLSTDGKLYTCLFASSGKSLREPLRNGIDDEQLCKIIRDIWLWRRDKYSETRASQFKGHPQTHKIEMYQIGG